MKKIAAFTLAEMIIALLLMVIVISTAYAAYIIVARTSARSIAQINSYADLSRIDQITHNQVSQSGEIEISNEDSALSFVQCAGKIIIRDSFWVYHSTGTSDTFTLNAKVNIGLIKDTGLIKDYVDQFDLILPEADTQLTFYYHKQYAADFYINHSKY